jgi:Flp pilus assembly protein CpaB
MATAVATRGTAPEGRNRLLVIGAIVFGLITAVLLFTALRSNDSGGTEDDAELAVGLPVRFPLQANEQVTQDKVGLSKIEDEKDLALVLPAGQRAFAVEASEVSAVGGNLLPGNTVDVIAVFDQQTFGATFSATVIEKVQVLAIAQEALEPVPQSAAEADAQDDAQATGAGIDGRRSDEVERQPKARSVTLAVDPEQAQLLAALQSQGDIEIWLALRSADDTADEELPNTDLGPFFVPPLQPAN